MTGRRVTGIGVSAILLTWLSISADSSFAEALEGPSETEEAACVRLALRPAPRWSVSGAWADGGSALVLPDLASASILRYDSRGRADRVGGDMASDLSIDHPGDIYRWPNGTFWVSDGPTRFVELARDLEPRRALDLRFWTVRWPDGKGWVGGTGPATPERLPGGLLP